MQYPYISLYVVTTLYIIRFMQFNDYRIPREYLLNRTGDVKEDGTYVTPYKVCR